MAAGHLSSRLVLSQCAPSLFPYTANSFAVLLLSMPVLLRALVHSYIRYSCSIDVLVLGLVSFGPFSPAKRVWLDSLRIVYWETVFRHLRILSGEVWACGFI